jgi:hypothetical protein
VAPAVFFLAAAASCAGSGEKDNVDDLDGDGVLTSDDCDDDDGDGVLT